MAFVQLLVTAVAAPAIAGVPATVLEGPSVAVVLIQVVLRARERKLIFSGAMLTQPQLSRPIMPVSHELQPVSPRCAAWPAAGVSMRALWGLDTTRALADAVPAFLRGKREMTKRALGETGAYSRDTK